jgi:hypothetical protein
VPEPAKTKLKKYFDEVAEMMSFMDARNRHIVEKTFAADANTAIVVGNFHVPGLKKLFLRRCN